MKIIIHNVLALLNNLCGQLNIFVLDAQCVNSGFVALFTTGGGPSVSGYGKG
jgi:hypothetical protein